MTQIVIDIGATANDGTGDPLRTAFEYVNNNFTQIFTAGPVDSNIRIVDNRILTINTNGNLVLAPNGIGKVMANVDILPTYANALSLGSSNNRWNTVYTRNIDITGDADFAGNINITGPATFGSDVVVAGNLTVNGTTTSINTTDVDITDKVITLAFGSPNVTVANNSGITIAGADANIKFLQTPGGEVWGFNKSVTSTGNITAIGNVIGHTIVGNIRAAGGNGQVQYNRNGIISASPEDFNYDETDGTLYVVAGQFAGNLVTGSNALYAGLPEFTFLGTDIVFQMAGNVSNYTQVNFQNTSNSVVASGDYIITADNGNDSTHFINMGMTSSTWDGSQPNSLGNRLGPNDGYLYVQDGNLAIGTSTTSTNVWKFDTSGDLTAPGNVSIAGIVKTGVFNTSTIPSAVTVGAGTRAFVTDADSTTFGAPYVGGASNSMPVFSNGTSWFIG